MSDDVTIGDYMRNMLSMAESIEYTIDLLYDSGVPYTDKIDKTAHSLACQIRRWLQDHD